MRDRRLSSEASMALAKLVTSCFSCCGSSTKGDPYLQPLNLINNGRPQTSGEGRWAHLPRQAGGAALRSLPLGRTSATSCCAVDELVEQSVAARERLWRSLGSLEPFALNQTASTSGGGAAGSGGLLGGPKWPAGRQSFRVIHRSNGNVMLVSDGLSDPFDDIQEGEGNVNGFGVEFYLETPGDEIAASLTEVKNSWQFQLLFTVAQLAAGHGGIRSIIDDMQASSRHCTAPRHVVPTGQHTPARLPVCAAASEHRSRGCARRCARGLQAHACQPRSARGRAAGPDGPCACQRRWCA